MSEVADLYVVLRAVGGEFRRGMAEAGVAAEGADSRIAGMRASLAGMALGAAAGGAIVVGAALKMSSSFDAAMEQIHTLAHVPQAALKGLSAGVLQVAGDVGYSPHSLAEALYHVESTWASVGITGSRAMGILRTAAEGARIGGANLVDVTNALDAAMVSGIPGAQNLNQAMGALLATVGAGDMTMQNLADAFSTGILAISKQYGVTLRDVGAALATFGDNNIRGSKAATDLRMSIMDLVKQSKSGEGALAAIGIKAGQLGDDMRKGGLLSAVMDLHNHLQAAGVTGTMVGKVLTDAFTKRASAPLAILLGELNQFQSKYPELAKGANSFGDAWARTSALLTTNTARAKANVEAAFIGLGHALTPIATSILSMFNHAFSWAEHHKKTMQELGNVIKTVLVGALVILGGVLAGMAVEAAIAAAPFIALSLAIGLLVKEAVKLYNTNPEFRAFVKEVVKGLKEDAVKAIHFFKTAFADAKKVVSAVVTALVGYYEHHKKAIDGAVRNTVAVLKDMWSMFVAAFDAIKAIVMTVVHVVENLWKRFGDHLLTHIVTAWNAIVQTFKGVFGILKGLFEIITGVLTGHWSKAWKGVKDLFKGIWDTIVGLLKSALNLISTIIGGTMALISAAWDAWWGLVKSAASAAWDGITNVFSAVGKFFEGVGKDIAKAWNAVISFFKSLPGRIWGVLKGAGTWLLHIGEDIIKGLLWGLKAETVGVYNWVVSQGGLLGIGEKIIHAVMTGISNAWHAVVYFFEHLPGWILGFLKGAGTWLLHTGEDLITGLWNGIQSAAKAVWNWLKGLPGAIWGFVRGAGSWLLNAGKNLITGLWNGIQSAVGRVWNWLTGLPQQFFNLVDNVGTWMVTAGENIVTGLWNGIVSKAEWLWNQITGWLNDIWGGIQSFFGIKSPSTLMRDTVGKHIVTGMALGITQNKHLVLNAMKQVATEASQVQATHRGILRVNSSSLYGSGQGMPGRSVSTSGNVTNVYVHGSVIDSQGLFTAVQKAVQQHGGRNPNSGLIFHR